MEKAYLDNGRLIKILITLSFLLISVALIVLKINSPVSEYELSIYSSISLFWLLTILVISTGIAIIVNQAFSQNYQDFWLAFFILILGNFIILSLPYSRGYYLYGGNDPNGHLHMTLSIVSNGYFGDNYYPITHILGAQLIKICSIKPETVIKLIPPLFSVLFMLLSYYLTVAVSQRKGCALLAAVASSAFLFSYYHVTVYPHALATFLFPLIFYLYFKSSTNLSYKVGLVILLLLLPFVHPVPSAVLIACLIATEIAKMVYKARKPCTQVNGLNISFNPAIISFITFFTWWSSYAVFGSGIKKVCNWFLEETKEIPRVAEVEPVFELSKQTTIELLIKMYGHQLLFSILSLIAMGIIFVYFWRKRGEIKNYFILSVVLLISAFTYSLIYFTQGFITVGRFLGANIGVWATPVLVAFFLSRLNRRKTGVLLVTSILIGSFTLSALSVYRSPWTLQPNWHFTYYDVSAISWRSEHLAEGFGYAWIGSPIGSAPKGGWEWVAGMGVVNIPSHFGYDDNTMLGHLLPVDTIIFLGEYRQRMASKDPALVNSPLGGTWAYPGYNDDDFYKLMLDPSVNILYSNGEDKILLVRRV